MIKIYTPFTSMQAKARAAEAIDLPNMEKRGHISIFEMSKFSLTRFDMNMHATQKRNKYLGPFEKMTPYNVTIHSLVASNFRQESATRRNGICIQEW